MVTEDSARYGESIQYKHVVSVPACLLSVNGPQSGRYVSLWLRASGFVGARSETVAHDN